MQLHTDIRQRVVVDTSRLPWTPSPVPGVMRRLLARDGGEAATATSIVRYLDGAQFPSHGHPGGEEILVLSGTFNDEHGSYPAGTYLRNPEGSVHAPHVHDGCELFVKLRQLHPADRVRRVVHTRATRWVRTGQPGVLVQGLAGFGAERTALVRIAAGARLSRPKAGCGEELLVLEGTLRDDHGEYATRTWLRNPPGRGSVFETEHGCMLLLKTDHLDTRRTALALTGGCRHAR